MYFYILIFSYFGAAIIEIVDISWAGVLTTLRVFAFFVYKEWLIAPLRSADRQFR